MAKVIQRFSYVPQGSGWLTGFRRLLARLGTGSRRPARLNPEEWSGHMLRDVGLPDRLAEGLAQPAADDLDALRRRTAACLAAGSGRKGRNKSLRGSSP